MLGNNIRFYKFISIALLFVPYKVIAIDYPNLDKKYYPYIIEREAFYDDEIEKVIKNVDKGTEKSGIYLGLGYGNNINFTFAASSSGGSTINSSPYNAFLLYGRIGYQNYKSISLPQNIIGFSVYLDILSSFGKGGAFYSGIGADLLADVLSFKSVDCGLHLGIGLGNAKITGFNSSKYEAAYKINLGFHTLIENHHKVYLTFFAMQAMDSMNISTGYILGYDYVF